MSSMKDSQYLKTLCAVSGIYSSGFFLAESTHENYLTHLKTVEDSFGSGVSKMPERRFLLITKMHHHFLYTRSSRNIVSLQEDVQPCAGYTSAGQKLCRYMSLVIFRV